MKVFTAKSFLLAFCLMFICFKPFQKKITIYSIGDSTMSHYTTSDNYPLSGWMMMIPPKFNDDVIIMNEGSSGSSTKSYRSSGRWKKVLDQVKPGDYVFIQFGHNDQKPDTLRHTEPRTSFRQNLMNYINETKAKGAQPVLFTSIIRRKFDDAGKLEDTHGEYVTEVRKLAKELQIPLVDLNKKTADLVENMGPDKSKALFLYVEPGIYKMAPEGKKDDTHLNVYGATKIAGLAIEGLKETKLPLVKYIR